MPYHDFFSDDGLGHITLYSGVVTGNELIKNNSTRYGSIEKMEKMKYILSDYSMTNEMNVSSSIIQQLAKMSKKAESINQDMLVAVVMPEDLAYGLGRMWQAYSIDLKWQSKIFRNREAAELWLNEKTGLELSFL